MYTSRLLKRVKARLSYENRGIAQSGSAPVLGTGCREFKSLYPDQIGSSIDIRDSDIYALVAQLDRATAF